MNILIVGAGPTGLTAAIELARRGILPTIIDRRETASTFSRAVGITPHSLELLSHSGASDALISEGIAIDGLRVYQGEKLSLEMELRSERTFHPNLVSLPQNRTEAILAKTLSGYGTDIQYGVKFEGLKQTDDGVAVKFDNGDENIFDHVIGADGIRSQVRAQAGIAYDGFDLEDIWSIADVDLANWRHPGCLTLVQAGPGALVMVIPMAESRYRVVASRENALDVMPLPLEVTRIRREGTFQISVRIAETYSSGRIHLAGDAAHCHSPVGGRGMNLGIADAADLAKRLIDGGMEDYTHARHAEAMTVRAITERGRKMSTGPNIARRIAFRTLVAAVSHLKPLQSRLSNFVIEF
jgi:2-polyprenyl-6-methoxyphenol hydroxylase-like FAD-dependent oxidoreductase